MTATPLQDKTGATVAVELQKDKSRYAISLVDAHAEAEAPAVGTSAFMDNGSERIFYHTTVSKEYGGRGLATILLQQLLADMAEGDMLVVPVCPMLHKYLQEHGEEFRAAGGQFREPTRADVDFVKAHLA